MLAVVEGCSCPSQSAITVTSVPDSNNRMAVECRRVCIPTRFVRSEEHVARAVTKVTGETVFDRVVAEPPAGDGLEQRIARLSAAFGDPDPQHPQVSGVSGVARSLRPLPKQCT